MFESSNAVLHRDSFISPTLKISEDISLDLMNFHCKNYCKLITEKSTAVPTSIKNWEKQFPVISDNWQKGFSYIYAASKDNKSRQFSFKFLHRIITTRKELKRYKLSDDDTSSVLDVLILIPSSTLSLIVLIPLLFTALHLGGSMACTIQTLR